MTVPEGWQLVHYSDVADVNEDSLPGSTNPDREIRYIDIASVPTTGRIDEPRRIRFEDAPSRARRVVEAGDTIVSTVRPYLRSFAFISDPGDDLIASTGFAVLSPRGVDPKFLYQTVLGSSFVDQLVESMTGTNYPAVNARHVEEATLLLPPLPEQRKIAAILSSVDDAIAATEAVIEQTRIVKQGLLQNLLTKGIGHTRFKQTPIGEVPEAWEVVRLGGEPWSENVLSIIDGDRGKNYPKQSHFSSSGTCLFLSARNVTREGFRFDDTTFVSEQRHRLLGKGTLERDDTVLTTRGTVGNSALYDDSVAFDCVRINSGMVILRPDAKRLQPGFLFIYTQSRTFSRQYEDSASGSAQPQLPIRHLNRLWIPIPPLQEQKRITDIMDAGNAMASEVRQALGRLNKVKSGLLQDLLTGTVRVTP